MKRLLLLCALLLACSLARAEGLWLSATTVSYHADREAGFNERNLGVGVEYELASDWRAIGGTFRNSVFRRSNYVGLHWAPLRFGNWRLGAIGGLVSGYPGYNYGWGPLAAPVLSWESGRFGANLIALPKIEEIAAVIALQVKIKF